MVCFLARLYGKDYYVKQKNKTKNPTQNAKGYYEVSYKRPPGVWVTEVIPTQDLQKYTGNRSYSNIRARKVGYYNYLMYLNNPTKYKQGKTYTSAIYKNNYERGGYGDVGKRITNITPKVKIPKLFSSKGGNGDILGGFGNATQKQIATNIPKPSMYNPTPSVSKIKPVNDSITGDLIGGFGDTGSYTASNIPKMKTPTAPTVSTQTYKPTQQSYKVNTNYTQVQRTLAYDDANVVSGINELINGMQMLVTEMRGTNAGVNKFNEKELVVNSTPVVYSPTTNNISAPQQPQQQQKNVQKSSFLDQASYTMARNIASGGL